MNESFRLALLASQVGDQSAIATHGFNQLRDEIEECLFAWKDKQATQFALNVEEPQQEAFAPLISALLKAEACLRDVAGQADRTEFTLNQIQVRSEPCKQAAIDALRKAEAANYHASGALQTATTASSSASALQARIRALGAPPI